MQYTLRAVAEPTLQNLLDVATEAAYLGGTRTLAYFNANVEVETKSDQTPVTIADREAEAIIRKTISRAFPTHSILGEESGASEGDPNFKWIIDPLDGTKSFIHGVPLYGTLIGVEVRGEPSVGVIYLPAMHQMLAAANGLGCRCNGRVAKVSSVEKLKEATLLVGSPISAIRRSDAFEKIAARAKLTRGWGDCYGYFLVATGQAEIMLDPAMNLWDCAPMLPILREAGGYFFDWTGKETINGKDAAATNGKLYEEVVRMLGEENRH